MEIAVNKAAELGVPATLDAPIQATFAKAKGWVQKWSQDRMVHEEKAAGAALLGVPGPSMVARLTSSGVDSLPSVKIVDPPTRKVSGFDTPWFVLTPDTVDARAGHGEEGQGRHPRHPRPSVLGVRGSGTWDLRQVQVDKVEV
jgi:hypothetical protein